jgi:hypothetical protein
MPRGFTETWRNDVVSTRASATIALALLIASGSGHAAMNAIEAALELEPGQAVLPSSASGQLVARPCVGCRPQVLRVDAATRYLVRPGREPVSFADFGKAYAPASSRASAMLFVYYDPRTRIVRRLVLEPGR